MLQTYVFQFPADVKTQLINANANNTNAKKKIDESNIRLQMMVIILSVYNSIFELYMLQNIC